MRPEYFPADVSLRVDGDIDAAQALFPAASQVLFRALRRQELGSLPTVSMLLPFKDGSLISVFVRGGLKHVYVKPAKRVGGSGVGTQQKVEEVEPPEELYVMHSGVVSGGVTPSIPSIYASEADPPVLLMSRFHPSAVTAEVYDLTPGWQDSPKLAVTQSGTHSTGVPTSWYPKPTMYTGKMQHAVQALLGIGRTPSFLTDEYLTGEPRTPDEDGQINVFNPYDYRWLRSHGIYWSEGGDPWLIEISKDEGVLAMPFRFFNGTTDADYRAYLSVIGDTDTVFMIDALGGLPTGETFPAPADLDDAIADGKVLRLAEPEDLAEFYHDSGLDVAKRPLFAACGWAFSSSGAQAVNTSFWYKDLSIIHAVETYPGPPRWPSAAVAAPMDERFMIAELWRIEISVSDYLTDAPTAIEPIGTGSASITRDEQELLGGAYDANLLDPDDPFGTPGYGFLRAQLRVPKDDGTEEVEQFYHHGFTGVDPSHTDDRNHIGDAPVFAFYVGEELEVVRQAPWSTSSAIYSDGWSMYYGTSLNPLPDLPTIAKGYSGCPLIVPAYVREGYLLPYLSSESTTKVRGFFGRLGEISFPDRTDVGDVQWFFDITNDYAVAQQAPAPPGSGHGMKCAFVANALNTPGHVSTRGFIVSTLGSTFPYSQNGYAQSENIAEYAIPVGTHADNVTFVGAP